MGIDRLRERLSSCLDAEALVADPRHMEPYCRDWLGRWHGRAGLVVRPANTQQVAYVHRMCSEMGIPIVPQGGNTGMSGGATPNDSGEQVLISLQRMQRVRRIDPVNNTLSVDAGVRLADARSAAASVERQLPLALGSEDSCTIGGNLATNAGGIHALRWGTVRDLALGLEVVLPDGRIWDGMRLLRKNNTGYDLKQLFIGSEGTLGTITGAVLGLASEEPARATAWLHVEDMAALTRVFTHLRQACGSLLSAFEFLEAGAVSLVEEQIPQLRCPVARRGGVHALVDLRSVTRVPLAPMLAQVLEPLLGQTGWLDEVAVAQNSSQAARMWAVREGISLAQRQYGPAIKHDIALPVTAVADFCEQAAKRLRPWLAQEPLGLRWVNFGHLGDGNLHFNLLLPQGAAAATVELLTCQLNPVVHDLVHSMGGSISAEHGIGQLRREENRRYKSSVEMDLMLLIKRALDPNLVMNPGKLF